MSGASVAATVPRLVSIEPKSFETTLTVAPFDAAHALATLVMAGARFASVQMTIVGPALCDATAEEAIAAAVAATTPSSAHVRFRLCIRPFFLRTTGHGAGWGTGTAASIEL